MHKIKFWLAAARLRTLPLSLSGIIIGCSLSGFYNKSSDALKNIFESKDYLIFIGAILTTIVFQVLSNFANDYGDGIKGTDVNRNGEARMVNSGKISAKAMKNATLIFAILGLCLSFFLISYAFKGYNIGYVLLFLVLGILSVSAAIKYTVGKKAYGYSGLGDVFVFVFFGLLSVCGSFFLYTKSLNFSIFLPAVSVGLLSTAVLNLNNMRDMANDKLANKNTLVVIMGMKWAKKYHYSLIILPLFLGVLYVYLNFNSITQFIFLIAYVPLFIHINKVKSNSEPYLLDSELKKVALSTFLFAILFSIFN